ncbi:uncharacterized protein LOC106133669 [Amyelois transitella]|uniref:uncharacterized protein LOC106133669 n=1 Tax=Amyelois transitella TaxID=680683 RepID=UPI00298FE38F|nr:uncharacterized protein LOC106133669 [Amyelois transitella]
MITFLIIVISVQSINEYHIVASGKCDTHIKTRRNEGSQAENNSQSTTERNDEVISESTLNTESIDDNEATTAETTDVVNITKSILRNAKKTTTKFVPLYEVDTAFDDHTCPLSCPEIYSPVCVSANRGNGLYFKFWTFVNHCSGDLYYCKNPDEFAPPPDESEEDVNASKLGWSYCGASRYLQFARFSESASSLGYYGWLSGKQKYSHIMEPYERKPGYG